MWSRQIVSAQQRALEIGTELKMALLVTLAGLVFRYAPSSDAFHKLIANGLAISPDILAFLCYVGAIAYAAQALITFIAPMRKRWRASIFVAASVPFYLYLGTLGLATLRTGFNFNAITYVAFGLIVFLLSFAVFENYHRILEQVTLILLGAIMALGAYGFFAAPPAWLREFNIPASWLVGLFTAGGIGYWLLLEPRVRVLSDRIKRLWFMLADVPIWVYAILLILQMLNTGNGSMIVPVAMIDLGLLIALFAYCFYSERVHD